MHLTFHGATREVTGSFHTISTEHDRIILDCGLFQGKRKEAERKNRVLPVDPEGVTNMILSHAHLDHTGRIPMVTREWSRYLPSGCPGLPIPAPRLGEDPGR